MNILITIAIMAIIGIPVLWLTARQYRWFRRQLLNGNNVSGQWLIMGIAGSGIVCYQLVEYIGLALHH